MAICDHAQILREIMTVYASSLGDAPSFDHDPEQEQMAFGRILDAMIDPAVQMCEVAADEKKKVKGRWDREVFVLNCLAHLQVCVAWWGMRTGSDSFALQIDRECWKHLSLLKEREMRYKYWWIRGLGN